VFLVTCFHHGVTIMLIPTSKDQHQADRSPDLGGASMVHNPGAGVVEPGADFGERHQ
jgi:hypothetical protein